MAEAINVPQRDSLAGLQLPQQPQPTGPVNPDLMTLVQQRMGLGDQSIATQRAIAAKEAAVPKAIPWSPNIVHGEGMGGFLHNVLQGLMAAGAATRPGQAVMEVAQAPARARRAQELQALQAQMQPEEAATKFNTAAAEALGGVGYKQGMLGIRQENADTNKQRADTAAKIAANRSADMLVREAQGWKGLDVKEQANRIRESFNREVARVADSRIAAGQEENEARIQAQEDVRAAASQNQYSVLHPFLSMLGVTPDLGAAPGAQQPKPIQTPKAPGKAGGKRVIDLTK